MMLREVDSNDSYKGIVSVATIVPDALLLLSPSISTIQ